MSCENKYPEAKCSASVCGFVVQIWLPHHPEFEDHLYPKEIEGLRAMQWLQQKPGVVLVSDRCEGEKYGYQVVVLASMTTEEQAAYAEELQEAINQAGFQW